MKKILYTFFLLGGIMLFANSLFAQASGPAGVYTLTATDSFGDGWNGSAVDITTPSAGTLNYTLAAGGGPEQFMFTIQAGEEACIQEIVGGFLNEVGYTIADPTGAIVVNVPFGAFTGATKTTIQAAAACAPGECPLAVNITATDSFGDGWNGGTLDVTVDGVLTTVTLPAGAEGMTAIDAICLPTDGSANVDVSFNPGGFVNEVGWTIELITTGVVTGDTDVLVVAAGDAGTSGSGTVVVTCEEADPAAQGPTPTVACGIFEIGKNDFLQAPSASAECMNGFNCEEMAGELCPNTTVTEVAASVDLAVPGPGFGGLPDATFPTFTVPASAQAGATLVGITYELCAAGDFGGPGEQADFVLNGTVVGSVFGLPQCGANTSPPNVAQECVTFTDCGSNAIGDVIQFSFTDPGNNAGFCDAALTITPTYQYNVLDPSEEVGFACIEWFIDATTTFSFFTGETLGAADIDALIATGVLEPSILCHEQITTLFVEANCGELPSPRVPVNIYTFAPCEDGCANYLELTDSGADGWEGAKLMVSVNEGNSTEVKLSASEGGCKVLQYCLGDGETLDLQYWEGADNFEHAYNVIAGNGDVLLANGPGPSTDVNRVISDCPDNTCAGESISATIRVTTGANPDAMSFELYDGNSNVNCQGPSVFGITANTWAGLPAGTQITYNVELDICNEYTIALFNGLNNANWGGATWELIVTDIDYGTEITNPNDPFFGQSVVKLSGDTDFATAVGEARTSLTFACKPQCVDATQIAVLGDCQGVELILPIATPEICKDCNHSIGCGIQFRHTILTDQNDTAPIVLGAFAPINGQTEFDYTALGTMTAGCHSYVTEYLYCDGLITKCTSDYTVFVDQTTNFSCNDNVIVPLGVPDLNPAGGFINSFSDDLGECVIRITADMVIEAGVPSNLNCEFFNVNDFYEVVILDANDQPLNVFSGRDFPLDSNGAEILPGANTAPATNMVSYNEIKQTLKYVVTHKVTGTTCWGTLTVEDKNAPTVLGVDYDVNCNDPNILNEFFSETTTLQSSAANELPYNIAGGDGGAVSNTWIPFTVPCGRLGTTITDIQVNLSLTHNDIDDLAVELHIPDAFNATLAAPFAGSVLTLDTGGDTGAVNTYTPNPQNDAPDLLGLLGASCKEMASLKDVGFTSETSGNTLPQGHGKTWYVRVTDDTDIAGVTPIGTGEITAVSMTFTCGYPFPYFAFDCALDNVELISEILDESCSNLSVIRVWKATDACGQSSNATQTVNILRPSISDLLLPSTEVAIECGTEVLDADGNVDTAQSGSPEFCCDQVASEDLCKLSISFEDDILESCGDSYKVLRTWSVLNWCAPTTTQTEYTQLIVVGDTDGPTINAAAAITLSAGADCTGSLSLTDLDITDACSAVTAVRLEYTTGSTYAGTSETFIIDLFAGAAVSGLPMGTTTATIIATDECGQTNSATVDLNVVDDVAPTVACVSNINLSLSSAGSARLFADAFDSGSNDNCSDVTVEVSNGGGFGAFVDFDCSDLGMSEVQVRATDAAGNVNTIWCEVLIEDPIGPSIVPKDDVTVTCEDELTAVDLFTTPESSDNCGSVVEAGDIIAVDLPNCGQLLTRTYTATDGSDKSDDVSTTQTITVVHVSDFIVQFPADEEFTDCALSDIPGPIITEDDCENVGISVEDRVFVQVEDACYQIERTYTIINHCIVDDPSAGGFTDLGTPLPIPNTFRDDDGYFQYTQIITVTDTEAPSITFTAPDPCDFTVGCTGEAVLTATAEDACSDVAAVELSYEIDAFSDGTTDITGSGDDATGDYPYGDHIIRWIATDGCGNVTVEEYDFSVEDCKAPTPVCQGVTTVIMNNGDCVSIWALDLLEYAEDNCTERTAEEWDANARIRREGDNGALSTSLDLCCSDIADGAVNFEVWIEDEAGNAEFCIVSVIIQDNGGNCPTPGTGASAMISGQTATEFGINVVDTEVSVNNDVVMTGTNGIYTSAQPTNAMYDINPAKLDGVAEGVSTFDLVLMAQHVLQINELTTPYQLIAGDVNADNAIDIFDMVELRQLILFSISDFSNNTSWRFVDAAYTFQNPTAPWSEAYPQSISVMNDGTQTNEDFIAVKIGDLDGDAQRPFTSVEERSKSTLTMIIDDVEMTAGNDYKVDFRASDFNEVTGYQFTLDFDQNAADFISVEAGALNVNESNFGFTMLDEGIITTSFTEMGKAISVENDEVLFSINFSAKANATLNDVVSLTNEYTIAQAYNSESEVSNVNIAFNNAGLVSTTGGEFELFQNKPNPFNESTLIGFNLTEAGAATLRVYDVSGKTLKVINANYARGYNEVVINRNELGAAGVLYYQLDTDSNSAVKKMIILE